MEKRSFLFDYFYYPLALHLDMSLLGNGGGLTLCNKGIGEKNKTTEVKEDAEHEKQKPIWF